MLRSYTACLNANMPNHEMSKPCRLTEQALHSGSRTQLQLTCNVSSRHHDFIPVELFATDVNCSLTGFSVDSLVLSSHDTKCLI